MYYMYLSCGLNQTKVQLDKVYSIDTHISTILIHFILSSLCLCTCMYNYIYIYNLQHILYVTIFWLHK